MSTFALWYKGFLKNPSVRPVTWLCGPERILVDDVLATIRKVVAPAPWNYVPLNAREDSERDIWAAVSALPQGPAQTRLVVVRSAEKLKQPERLSAFMKRSGAHPQTFLVLVSDEHDLPRLPVTEDQRRRGVHGDLVGYLRSLSGKGHLIECKPFTTATASVAVSWVRAKTGMREATAVHLLTRADGDMRLVRDTCGKLALFGGEITMSAINELLAEQPRDSLVDALVAMDKRGALLALEQTSPEEYGRVLGLLDSRLDLAGLVHDMLLTHHTSSEIARAAGNKNFLVRDLLTVSRHYDRARRSSIRRALCTADEALRAGARVGVVESVIALW